MEFYFTIPIQLPNQRIPAEELGTTLAFFWCFALAVPGFAWFKYCSNQSDQMSGKAEKLIPQTSLLESMVNFGGGAIGAQNNCMNSVTQFWLTLAIPCVGIVSLLCLGLSSPSKNALSCPPQFGSHAGNATFRGG